MAEWDLYERRLLSAKGGTTNGVTKLQRKYYAKSKKSIANTTIVADGRSYDVIIEDTSQLNKKVVLFMSDNSNITNGSIIECFNSHWLITEKDARSVLYTKATIEQCNYLLKWTDLTVDFEDSDRTKEQWCIISNKSAFDGETEDRNKMFTYGTSKILLTVGKNKDTIKISRGQRFFIDELDSPIKLVYSITSPLKVGQTYNGEGVFKFVLEEDVPNERDNIELGITDYYVGQNDKLGRETEGENSSSSQSSTDNNSGKKVWI